MDFQELKQSYNPKNIVMEDWNDFNQLFEERGNSFENFSHRRKNIISMFYKFQQGMSLLENHSAKTGKIYDLVIRMRPDLILHENLLDFDPNFMHTVAHRNHLGQGTGDMFHASSMMNMILFSKLSCYIDYVYQQTNLLCPHV